VAYSLLMAAGARSVSVRSRLLFAAALTCLATAAVLGAAGTLQPPDQFIGFRVGADNQLARWDKIVDYMKLAASASDRVRVQDLGASTDGNPFIAVFVGDSDTIKNLERYRQFQRRLYFRNGTPSARERDEIFRQGKAVVVITAGVHSTEVGPTQATLELVHRLATDDSPATRRVLDNVLLIIVPSANPDGHVMVTDWFYRNVGTPFEVSPLPHLYHKYAGHDLNRDMYMLTQKESQYIARLVWNDWLPEVWLDQHQMNSNGARMFVMPAADPINPNVHPLIYRWNGILGQSQAAALEAAGKEGIIYNSTYTNFWQGPLAWSGWWHNQIGLLTEIASARTATPIEQLRASAGQPGPPNGGRGAGGAPRFDSAPLLPPSDIVPRTEYPRPWMGGRWTLRDIVDYSAISTIALLETVADRRETILRNIFEINRQTVEERRRGDPTAIVIAPDEQHDAREVGHLIERLRLAGVDVYRAEGPFESERRRYVAGAYVIPMSQVFARYAKDLLEPQVYPEVRRGPNAPAEPPYDVTAWSLGMLLGVTVDFVYSPLAADLRMTPVQSEPRIAGRVQGSGARFTFEYSGADTAIAINRLLKAGARVELDRNAGVSVTRVGRDQLDGVAREFGLAVTATDRPEPPHDDAPMGMTRAPRVGVYAPFTSGNMDEGWTRWVLEQYEFAPTTINNETMRRGNLRQRFDVLVIPDQLPREIIDGYSSETVRPEYRGGIGELGVEAIIRFVGDGGTLIALGAASDLAIDRLPIPVRNLKRTLRREQHYAPGTILNLQIDPSHPLSQGVAPETFAFYTNSPFFAAIDGFTSYKTTVAARFPAVNVVASGWLQGEELMAGRAAVVSIDMNPGRVVLFGIRPQHRGQTHATFPLLFNALYQAAADAGGARSTNQ
jgi:hypothetical protein